MRFKVADVEKNLLGQDILESFCCIIDLEAFRLTVRKFDPEMPRYLPKAMVRMADQDVSVLVDTGADFYLYGPLDDANKLNLPLKQVNGVEIEGVGYKGNAPYLATNISLKAFGREVNDAWYMVQPEGLPMKKRIVVLGMHFLHRSIIQFDADGTFAVTFPEASEQPRRN